ncbi:hypothetical protein PVL29_026013 [Vitis rotundifolia]|uniref:Uncharacterized protein n=1 Tax=Vitis rotundifolia TaxID=103349 RepID=A0AA38YLE7_VITRO|nr:hypothetical protein PVL29_026013 [Vitis rotundifolia]
MTLSSLRIPKWTRVPFMMSFMLGWKSYPVLKSVEIGVVDSLVVPMPKSGDSQETSIYDLRERAGLPDNFPHAEDLREKKVKNQFSVKDIADLTPKGSTVPIQEKDLSPYPHVSTLIRLRILGHYLKNMLT